MTENERYWLAGLFEGEACFTPSRRPSGHVSLRIQLSMSDEDVVRRAREIVGWGTVIQVRQSRSKLHSFMWKLSLSGAEAAAIMDEVYSLMGARRKAQIEEAFLERRAYVDSMNHPRWNSDHAFLRS